MVFRILWDFTYSFHRRKIENFLESFLTHPTMLKPFPMCSSTLKTYTWQEFRLKTHFSVTSHVCKNLTMKMYMFQMTCAYLPVMENERYYYIHIVETIYHDTKWESVINVGGFGPDMTHLTYFWGTLKMKKFVNVWIKVCEDEIFGASVWYH